MRISRWLGASVIGVALTAFGVTNAVAAPPVAPGGDAPLHAAKSHKITGQYIVVLKDDADGRTVAGRHGVNATHVFNSALRGFSAQLSNAQLAQIRRDPSVAYVDEDALASINDKPAPGTNQTAPGHGPAAHDTGVSGQSVESGATWGIDRVDQYGHNLDGAYHYTSTGSGVTAYVIDTGINRAHAEFGGRASGGFSAINDGNGANDCNGHGTHVSGTIGGAAYGVAKAVSLVAVRVLDCSGSGSWSGVIAGIDYVTFTHNGPSVANMSLGGGFTQSVNDAVDASIARGVSYSIAAGNSNDNACNYSPSSATAAMTVGATSSGDARAYFSNVGPCVDLFAPGVAITSAWIGSSTATNTISGTSMAAPHVAGLIALYLQDNPTATQPQVNAILKTDAVAGIVTDPGAGSPNLEARKWNGTVANTGSSSYEPDGGYWYQATSGYIQAWLQGTAGTDADLYLQQWTGSSWASVASSISVTPQERVVYFGAGAKYYRLQVYAYSGGGTYDAWAAHPA